MCDWTRGSSQVVRKQPPHLPAGLKRSGRRGAISLCVPVTSPAPTSPVHAHLALVSRFRYPTSVRGTSERRRHRMAIASRHREDFGGRGPSWHWPPQHVHTAMMRPTWAPWCHQTHVGRAMPIPQLAHSRASQLAETTRVHMKCGSCRTTIWGNHFLRLPAFSRNGSRTQCRRDTCGTSRSAP